MELSVWISAVAAALRLSVAVVGDVGEVGDADVKHVGHFLRCCAQPLVLKLKKNIYMYIVCLQ